MVCSIPAVECAEVGCYPWWILLVDFTGAAKETGLAHSASIARDAAGLTSIVGVLGCSLFPPSPQEEDEATY